MLKYHESATMLHPGSTEHMGPHGKVTVWVDCVDNSSTSWLRNTKIARTNLLFLVIPAQSCTKQKNPTLQWGKEWYYLTSREEQRIETKQTAMENLVYIGVINSSGFAMINQSCPINRITNEAMAFMVILTHHNLIVITVIHICDNVKLVLFLC